MELKTSIAEKGVVLGASLVLFSLFLKLAQNVEGDWNAVNVLSVQVAFFLFLGVVAYLPLSRAWRARSRRQGLRAEGDRTSPAYLRGEGRATALGLGSCYVVSLTLAFWQLRNSLYVPVPAFYLWLSVAFAMVGLGILFLPRIERRGIALILLQILVLAVLIRLAYPWLNPGLTFSDNYFHWLGVETIASEGRIPTLLAHFFYFPDYMVFNAVLVQVVALSLAEYLLVNHLLLALVPLGAYLLGRTFLSPRVALMAALLICVSIFFFMRVRVGPVFLGILAMAFTLYALLKFRRNPMWRWWATLWLGAAFVFFSHPVNALILAAILGAYWMNGKVNRSSSRRGLVSPTATYWVAYVGYLGFIAFRVFSLFVESLFESGPVYYLARAGPGVAPPERFMFQLATSTLGHTALFLPAGIAALFWLFRGGWEQRLLVGAIVALATVPAIMVLAGRGQYGLQAVRTLPYLNVLLVFPAAYGIVQVVQSRPRRARRAVGVAVLLMLLALLSSTSYLTSSGNRFLTEAVPVDTAYATDSMLATRAFLLRVPEPRLLALDPVLAHFLAPHGSGVSYPYTQHPIPDTAVVGFATGLSGESHVLAVSDVFLDQQGYQRPNLDGLDEAYAIRAYTNGVVRVYLAGGG